MICWKDESDASVLETMSGINACSESELITSELARQIDLDHIAN